MHEFNLQSEIDLKENYATLSKKPIVKMLDDNLSPKKNTPLMKLNENFLTPLRGNCLIRSHTPGTPYAQTPTQDPMIETPNGTKIFHPFLSNIIRNLDKSFMSPNIFTLKENSVKDDSVLSPDLAGELFPVEIDIDADTQYRFEAALYTKYEKYCNKKTDIFFKKGTIAPSPDNSDSGMGISLQNSNSTSHDSDRNSFGPMSLLVHKTPPSQYKWNRDEFRHNRTSPPTMDFANESGDDDEAMDFSSHKYNLESTKIFDDFLSLESNLSMRNHSVIVSPMFDDEEISCNDMNGSSSFDRLRSSPSWKFSCSAMDDLAMSPIIRDFDMKKNREEEVDEEEFGY